MKRSIVLWDGERPVNSIQQVWDYTTVHLRQVRDNIRLIGDHFYSKMERMTYLRSVNDSLKIAFDTCKNMQTVGNLHDLELVLEAQSACSSTSSSPRQLAKAQECTQKFMDKIKISMSKLADASALFSEDVVSHLENYCANYPSLGVTDDRFFKNLGDRTVSIRNILKDFNKVLVSLRQSLNISSQYFCDSGHSQAIALEFNCDMFPILRIVPDLLQKLETACEIAQDWIRSDKVFVEQVKQEIDTTRETIKSTETQHQLNKLEYDKIFSLFKTKQLECEDIDESYESIWTEISKLEIKKTRLELEIAGVAKTLNSCRGCLRDLSSIDNRWSDASSDEVDGCAPALELRTTYSGKAHSGYRRRVSRDARAHTSKLHMLRLKKKKVEKRITHRKNLLRELENNESDIQQLGKKLRVAGRKKTKCSAEVQHLNGRLVTLEGILRKRLYPLSPQNGASKQCQEKQKTAKERKSKHSAELHKAFRIIKNNIGLSWKDLARSLPYSPRKEICEINNEIRVIEYENHGQLKEQAYQSLIKWYSHCGRRASVEVLHGTLQELNENRLAENIEKEVLGVANSANTNV